MSLYLKKSYTRVIGYPLWYGMVIWSLVAWSVSMAQNGGVEIQERDKMLGAAFRDGGSSAFGIGVLPPNPPPSTPHQVMPVGSMLGNQSSHPTPSIPVIPTVITKRMAYEWASQCVSCHSMNVMVGGIPSLAGRSATEMTQSLRNFRNTPLGPQATVMPQIVKGYTDEQLEHIATQLANWQFPLVRTQILNAIEP